MARDNLMVQSLARGLEVLRIVTRRGPVTASSVARDLGLHQTSVSRLLGSLRQAGFVYKPDFHSFAVDYGALLFAGIAMESFAEIPLTALVCADIHRQTTHSAAAAVLREGRLLYLARVSQAPDASLQLVSDSSFPVHQSSLGLVLAHAAGPEEMRRIVEESIAGHGDRGGASGAEELCARVGESLTAHGILYLRDFGANRFNAALPFNTPRGTAALAVYSGTRWATVQEAADILMRARRRLEADRNLGREAAPTAGSTAT